MIKVVTAVDGATLREYAQSMQTSERVAVFPESGLSAKEQAAFMLNNSERYDEIVTFSPYIISDAPKGSVVVLDDASVSATNWYGSSVNKIAMNLWHRNTIGDVAAKALSQAREDVANSVSIQEIDAIIDRVSHEMGDSIEKMLMIKFGLEVQKKLEDRRELLAETAEKTS